MAVRVPDPVDKLVLNLYMSEMIQGVLPLQHTLSSEWDVVDFIQLIKKFQLWLLGRFSVIFLPEHPWLRG